MLGLVTGNFEPVARLKLARAGIGLVPGEGGGIRVRFRGPGGLPAIARRRVGKQAASGTSIPREDTIVIGDTPRDIACA